MEAAAKTAPPEQATQPGPKTPGDTLVANTPSGHVLDQAPLVVENVVLVPEVGTGSDLTVALIPQPLSPALVQSQLATHPGRAQALPEEFPLLATPEGVRNPGMRQDPEIPTKQAQLKELERLCDVFGYQTPGTSKDPEIRVSIVTPVPQFKFTEPRKLNPEWILEVKDRPNVIKVYIIKVVYIYN